MDKKYWDDYYQQYGKDKSISGCSSFAAFCVDNFFTEKSLNIIELGSGNGRDAIFLARHNYNVVAIDQSTTAINIERQRMDAKAKQYLHPEELDFVQEDYSRYEKIDAFYSRFSMHSISKQDEVILLPNVYRALSSGGLFCIEVRTINDSLCGVGEDCGNNTFITDNHKRRFIDSKVFREHVSDLGFKELYFIEENNLSIYKDDNPVLMRIILQK